MRKKVAGKNRDKFFALVALKIQKPFLSKQSKSEFEFSLMERLHGRKNATRPHFRQFRNAF